MQVLANYPKHSEPPITSRGIIPPPEYPTAIGSLLSFREIWVVDFEFNNSAGEVYDPVCCVAWELKSGKRK